MRWGIVGLAVGLLVGGGAAAASEAAASEANAAGAGAPEASDAAADAPDDGLAEVVVTSRNREESSQDVPIPMSVIQSDALVRDGTVGIQDLTQKAPGLEATTPNSRRTGVAVATACCRRSMSAGGYILVTARSNSQVNPPTNTV